MHIYFVRHGESQANLLHEFSNRGLKHGLTLKGRQQAERLARRLEGLPIRQIYSSPLLRAIETSVILAGRLRVEYTITDALREYDCGNLEGRSDEAAWSEWRELFDAWTVGRDLDRRLEGGESFYDIRARFEPFINKLIAEHAGTQSPVGCVGHGGLYWMMLPLILRNVTPDFMSRHGFGFTTCITAENRVDGLYCVEWDGQTSAP